MSIGGSDYSWAPHTADTQAVFQTWCSASAELAPSACPPQTLKAPRSLYGTDRKKDRALFPAIRALFEPSKFREALLNVLLVGGAVGVIVTVAAAMFIVPYIVFFVEL